MKVVQLEEWADNYVQIQEQARELHKLTSDCRPFERALLGYLALLAVQGEVALPIQNRLAIVQAVGGQ